MEIKISEIIEEYKKRTEKECYSAEIVSGEPSILEDKLGGTPYLPIGEEYPKDKNGDYMPLLLQVNLKNIELEGYPREGILEVFMDKGVTYPCEYAIRYYEEGREYQEVLPQIDTSEFVVENPFKLEFNKEVCNMPITDYRFAKVIGSIVKDLYGQENNMEYFMHADDYLSELDGDWYDVFGKEIKTHDITIGGYADFTQYDPRESVSLNKDECLFKIDSNANPKIFIGDSGIIFSLISKEDIENRNFTNALVDWDCC